MPKKKPRLNKKALFSDLGYEPHPGQWEVHSSTASRKIVCSGVRWGKSLAAAAESVAAALQPVDRSFGWVVGPNYDLADKVFREIVILVTRNLRHRIISLKENEKRVSLRNMSGGISEIRAKSADNPTSLLGEGLSWLVIDEAARLKPSIWQNHLSQRLIDRRGSALLISTPAGRGWLYDLFRRGQGHDPEFESWNFPSWDNPYLDAKLIEAERDRLPERVFRQEYGAEFLEGAGQVFRHVRESAVGTWQEPQKSDSYVAGLDLAKVEDFSVLTVMNQKREVTFLDRFHRIDWDLQVKRIKSSLERYHNCLVVVDSTGAGEPVYEALRKAGCHAEAYPFTARSKSDLINSLAIMFEKREITIPRAEICPELVDECESYEYSITDSGNVRMGAPSGCHDDIVISLALASWRARKLGPPATPRAPRRGQPTLRDRAARLLGVDGTWRG